MQDQGYAGSWVWDSANPPSKTVGEKELASLPARPSEPYRGAKQAGARRGQGIDRQGTGETGALPAVEGKL